MALILKVLLITVFITRIFACSAVPTGAPVGRGYSNTYKTAEKQNKAHASNTRSIYKKTSGIFLQIPFLSVSVFRFDQNRYENYEKWNLKEFGVVKSAIKRTSSSKNVQTIPFEGIRLKEFEGIWSFFSMYSCMRQRKPGVRLQGPI